MKILIVDDDPGICKTLELHFSENHEVRTIGTVKAFWLTWPEYQANILLVDLKLPDGNGIEILKKIRAQDNTIPVIMITGHSDMESPIHAMRIGATDYIQKPLDIEEIEIALARVQSQILQNRYLHKVSQESSLKEGRIVGHSKAITEVLKQIGLVSQGKVNVHITGESGTGKELVARTIHLYSNPNEPFVAVNCSALAPALIESELFGHEKGSFTHALQQHEGRLERSGAGTLFLDEIGELPLEHQVKLLRVIQEREFERVGGNKPIPFHARIISATNQNIAELLKKNLFREDLYFRLCTHTIHIPPLRDRIKDIPELVEYLIQKINRELHKKITKIPEIVLHSLQQYSWPGNIRELENVLMRSALLCAGEIFELAPQTLSGNATKEKQEKIELCSLSEVEKQHIQYVLNYTGWNISHASAILGISRITLRKKIQEYGLQFRTKSLSEK